MEPSVDGPATSAFLTVDIGSGVDLESLLNFPVSQKMKERIPSAPAGDCVCWGIPFSVKDIGHGGDRPVSLTLTPFSAEWIVFMHTSDIMDSEENKHGFISPTRGRGNLNEEAAVYVLVYEDGTEEAHVIRRRHQIGAHNRTWGENCFEAVGHIKPHSVDSSFTGSWGFRQTRATAADLKKWLSWLWAWKNPHPEKTITSMRLEPGAGTVVLMAISAGNVSVHPLRWESRKKALLSLPESVEFEPGLDKDGMLQDIRLDMGQIISAQPRKVYPGKDWESGFNNRLPEPAEGEILIEYTAHPDAAFHLRSGKTTPVGELTEADVSGKPSSGSEDRGTGPELFRVKPDERRVRLRVVEKGGGKPVSVKLHVHGESGEYLAPVDRHRIPNNLWFEDYSVDFVHAGSHFCTYISGETEMRLPLGKAYIEVSKGYEIRPMRKTVEIDRSTKEITLELERVLRWRDSGWVSADTHVHFLSPPSAMLEGSAEGVNVVNLLASQWGELMTNVGDFDGRTTWGSRDAGGDGEYLVRVGTENRQHILGHISLIGYEGGIIGPMTTGGPDESAIGDPVEVLLTEWARQCREKGGVVVIPHFPNPRAEHAAAVVDGGIDAIEMTSWGDLYSGIDPYSLSDWYRYLNCGYFLAAVGGTDKMSAGTAVGTVRTYARIPDGREFTYSGWMDAVKRGETFVTYGPLIEFSVDGKPLGSRIEYTGSDGTCSVEWKAESVTVPMSRVELVVNDEIRESLAVGTEEASGSWSVKMDRSGWLALLVRGSYPGKPEIIAAHSSPVMIKVGETPFLPAADALTILEQIEGALVYLDVLATRADTEAYKRMRLVLEGAHRGIHNRMHEAGHYHEHIPSEDHPEHNT